MPKVGRNPSQEIALRGNQHGLQESATPSSRGRGRNNNSAPAGGLAGLAPRPRPPERSDKIDAALSRMAQTDADQEEIQSTAADMTTKGLARTMDLKGLEMLTKAAKDAMSLMSKAGEKID